MSLYKKKYTRAEIAEKLFNNKSWIIMYDTTKNDIINQIIEISKRDISNNSNQTINDFITPYNINISDFIDFPITFKWDKECAGQGEYNAEQHQISLDYSLKHKINGGIKSYYVLNHEIMHAFQDYLVTNKDMLAKQITDKNLRDNFLRYTELFKFSSLDEKPTIFPEVYQFQPNDEFRIYVNNNMAGSKDNIGITLSEMFYFLNIPERMAFLNEDKVGDKLIDIYNENHKTHIEYNGESEKILEQLKLFQSHYELDKYLSNKDLNQYNQKSSALFDNCCYDLAHNIQPKDNLCASIMYDLYYVCLFSYEYIDDKRIYELICEQKEENIKNCEFNFEEKINLEGQLMKYFINPTELLDLTVNQQNDNIEYIIMIAGRKDKFEVSKYIKDNDFFKNFCIENESLIKANESLIDGVRNIFGDNFYERNTDLEDSMNRNEEYKNDSLSNYTQDDDEPEL